MTPENTQCEPTDLKETQCPEMWQYGDTSYIENWNLSIVIRRAEHQITPHQAITKIKIHMNTEGVEGI